MDKRANIENKAIIGDRAISGDMAEFYLEKRQLQALETRQGVFWRQPGTY